MNAITFNQPTVTESAMSWIRQRFGFLASAVCLPFLLLLISVSAARAQVYEYTEDFGEITITGYHGTGGAVTIPATIDGMPVVSIGDFAFAEDTNVTSVTMGSNVISIGNEAFSECTSLTGVTIGSGVGMIGEYAFSYCPKLLSITVNAANEMYRSVSGVLFDKEKFMILQYPGGKAGSYVIPTTVTEIATGSFEGCVGLTGITIPASINYIPDYTFYGCTGLTSFTVHADNPMYSSVGGVLFDVFGGMLIQYPPAKTGSYTVSGTVTDIGGGAFGGCANLTSVTIPDSVTSIGDFAFTACPKLTTITVTPMNSVYSSVDGVLFDALQTQLIQCPGGKSGSYVIPSTVNSISVSAFDSCVMLTSVMIPESVSTIQDDAFSGCASLTSVTIGSNVTNIGYGAFYGCSKLASVTIPASVSSIGGGAFMDCSSLVAFAVDEANTAYSSADGVLFDLFQNVLIQFPSGKTGSYMVPDTVSDIYYYAFNGCTSLTSITIPESVTSIGGSAFHGCSNLISVKIPDSITNIEQETFADCVKLSSVTIGDNVFSIGDGAFSGCSKLTGVTFGSGISSIENNAFDDSPLLTRATFTGFAPSLGTGVFGGAAASFTVYYPSDALGFESPKWYGYTAVATTDLFPEISVEQPVGILLASGFSTSVFAPTLINGSTVNTFTIRNTGSGTLRDIAITKDGPHAADFTVGTVPTTLAVGASTTFTVTFKPSAAGIRAATIHLANNDLYGNPFVIALSGTVAVPDIAVELMPGNIPLDDGTGTVSCGDVSVNATQVKTFTVRNTGTAPLTSLVISKTGTNSSEFTVSALGATTLAPGLSTTFTVSFKPLAVGVRSAAISIASNVVGTKNPYTISLNGNGVTPEIGVEHPPGTNLTDGSTTALAYGTSVLVGTQVLKTFTVRNTGTTDLTGLAITTNGTHAADFSVTENPVAPVPPGGSTTFTVAFQPSAAGVRTAAIHIANNDLNENPFDINLTGTGVAPSISVEQPAATVLSDGVSVINYGSSLVAAGLARTFTIKNPGTYPLTNLAITIDGNHNADFTLTTAPVTSVAAGGSTTFIVTFKPSALGVRTAALHIASNVTGTKNPFDIGLTGTGILPDIAVEQPAATILTDGASTVTFTPTLINTTKANTFTIRNTGTATLSGISITKDGPNAADFTIGTVATSVGVNLTTTFTVTFKPSAVGPREVTIRIASSDPDESPFDIQLSGTGIAPDIAVELMPDNIPLADGNGTAPFGVVAVAATKAQTFTLRNTGTYSLSGLVISKTGTNSAEFTVSALGATTLAPGLTTTFTVTFKPTALGARTAAINIANNVGGTKNPFTINLSGGLSNEARLAGLAISEGLLSPSFASGVFAYETSVGNSTSSLTVTPTVTQTGAAVKVNGVTVASGTASNGIPLALGTNRITIVVTAPDGVTAQSYAIDVNLSADSYANWAESNNLAAGNSGVLEDPDRDGTLNLLEFAFDTDPLGGVSGSLTLNGTTLTSHGSPFMAESPGPVFHAVFGRRADHVAAGLNYRVQFSIDMNDWNDSQAVPAVLADDGVIQVLSVPFPAGVRQFFRVQVSQSPN